jgi:ATP-dependent Clp protease ATP-binding subunit ClpC
MHRHLSARAEKVLKLADCIAREYEQDYVGTEQILLAIVREGTGLAVRILEDRGLDEARVQAEVDRLIRKSLEDSWVLGRLPGTPHFQNVVANAIEEAERLSAKQVCTEHLLLGLLREPGCVAHTALTNHGVTLDGVREAVAAYSG